MLFVWAIVIFLCWVAIASTLIGIGSIVLSLFHKEYLHFDALWMGLALTVAFLEIWNLLLPITSSAAILLLGIGVLGLFANRSRLVEGLRASLHASPWVILSAIAIVLLIAFRSVGPCDYYDTGLYGAAAVRWIQTYPAVPGLANLHGRLGFNSSIFLIVATLQRGALRDLAHHLFTGFLMSALCLTLLPASARIAAKATACAADWFHSILAIPAIFWATRAKVVGTLTDEPASIACLVATGILFDDYVRTAKEPQSGPDIHRLLVATTLFSLAVSFKLSIVVFAVLAWWLAFRRIWLRTCPGQQRKIYLAASLVLSIVVLLPWCIRSVVLTGYPFFPATILGFPVDWKIPLSVAKWYALGVQSWGRIPDVAFEQTRGYTWLGVWLHHAVRNRVSFQVPIAISLAGLALALAFRKRRDSCPTYPWLWLLLPSLAGLCFWFWASPDMRFGQCAIWAAAGTLGSWGIVCISSERPAAYSRVARATLLLLLVWCLISFGWSQPYRTLLAVKELPGLPNADLTVRYTVSELAVYVPSEGIQCWDAPLPCTPYFDETLRLRDKNSVRSGFTVQPRAENVQEPSSVSRK